MNTTTTTARYRTITASAAARRGMRAATISADNLYNRLPADGSTARVWVGFGHVYGREMFSTTTVRRGEYNGTPRIDVVRADGTIVMAYPVGQGRTLRTLVTTA